MATPARNLILENVATVLASITTGNGYKTTVDTVERVVKDWTGAGAQALPWLGYMPGRERFKYDPCGVIFSTLPLTIVGHVAAATASARSDQLSDLLDDVIAALNLDTTRGANAVSTTVLEGETDEGDPDAGRSGSFVLTAEVLYERTTGSS